MSIGQKRTTHMGQFTETWIKGSKYLCVVWLWGRIQSAYHARLVITHEPFRWPTQTLCHRDTLCNICGNMHILVQKKDLPHTNL